MDRYRPLQSSTIDPIQLLRVHSPKILLVVSVYFVYFFYRTGRTTFVFPVLGAVFGSLFAIGIVSRKHPEYDSPEYVPAHPGIGLLTRPRFATTVILLYISVVLITHSNALYSRPAIAYPLHGLAFGYLALNIYVNGRKAYNLVLVFLVALATYWSAQLVFPSGSISNRSHIRWGMEILQIGHVPEAYTYSYHPGFALHTGALAEITTITPWKAYAFLAVVTVAGTVFVIGSLDRVIPSLSSRAAQFAALIFVTATFTLNRGLQPHTTSFFYIHTAIILLVIFAVLGKRFSRRFALVGLLVVLAAIFGHTFSAGAPVMIVLFAIPLFVVYQLLPIEEKRRYAFGSAAFFFFVYATLFFAHQFYFDGHIYGRAVNLLITIQELFQNSDADSGSTGTSDGIYGELPSEMLLQATFGDLLWFTLLFAGICVLIARSRYDLDMVALIVAGGFAFLATGVVIHGADIPAQRVYQVIIVFGGCVAAGVGLLSIANITPPKFRSVALCSIVVLFAAFSLFSPVASLALTPLEIPHSEGHYSTAYSDSSNEWAIAYADGELPRDSEFMYVDNTTVSIDLDNIEADTLYVYDMVYAESGIEINKASEFGELEVAFIEMNTEMQSDQMVYNNGETILLIKIS